MQIGVNMKNAVVEIKDVNKSYGNNHIVKDLNLTVYEGEFLTLLGSSGCGKTTTLRMIAGFEEQTSGSILVQGEDIASKAPFERDVNTVFQSYALFPHMNVYDNVAYGLKIKKIKKSEIKKRVMDMLDLVQLGGFEKRFPSNLSGGQKQRVAIARALINKPKVLLLDEPLGALDLKLRKQMQLELKRLQKKLNITFIYVTHDQEEALSMSDRVAIMHQGVLEQVDIPYNIYENPKTKFVATFIGETNLFEGYVKEINKDEVSVVIESGIIKGKGSDFSLNEIIAVSVRPERMKYSLEPVEGFTIEAKVKEQVYVGATLKTIAVLPNGSEVKLERLAGQALPSEGTVFLYWENEDAKLLHSPDQTFYNAVENIKLA
ncbi:spermidine/putrescine transport system ATP-binding protein [[Clostridium] fimetarium]|uniref:Spermidine/putrescine import ATP-binding protein PotA n=2 Tax=[Clostridium] fimetarium TaxID=99656 RepID=A0A1I0RH69_9FIRM|nr:spermidine/putrescine transport system ATP-binding protein [[Clostridium] fimetarium]